MERSWKEVPRKLTSRESKNKQVQGDTLKDFTNQQVVMEAQKNDSYPAALQLDPPWTSPQRTSHARLNLLPARSTVIPARSARDMPNDVLVPVRSVTSVKGVSQLGSETLKTILGSNSVPIGSSPRMDANSVTQYHGTLNWNNYNAPATVARVLQSDRNEIFDGENCHNPETKYLSLLREGESSGKFMSMESQTAVHDHAPETQKSNDEVSNVCQQSPKVTIAVPSYSSRQTQKRIAERLRRVRVNETLKSMQELLPHSEEAKKEAAMDGIIDYVKYLQLQLKTLSQSRLDGEATDNHFINLEGFGHYLIHQQMLNEPLEDMVGRLMESNMPLFKQLLESKGLDMMPMTLARGLLQDR